MVSVDIMCIYAQEGPRENPFHKMASSLLILTLLLFAYEIVSVSSKSFVINYECKCFLKDGQPFRYVSGSFHYARVPSALWGDRLKKMRAAGLNALQTYVPWNFHEISPGEYDFSGDRNLVNFLLQAQQNDLLVLLRPGPYIDAEWEFGGFPSWLLKEDDIKLRTFDSLYLKYVDKWLSTLLPLINPLLYQNGGPIVMIQVENEYGSYGCDRNYISHLEGKFREFLGDEIILYSTDGCYEDQITCGHIVKSKNTLITVDFGVKDDPKKCFEILSNYENGPLVNSEFYTGWIDLWGESTKSKVDSNILANTLDKMLALPENISINLYMFEGGTNFGFHAGSNVPINGSFSPVITSYDYDAPLTEAGDPWEKFTLIREVISKYLPLPPGPVPPASSKTAYRKVEMKEYAWLIDTPYLVTKTVVADNPLTFEELDQSYGFVIYRYNHPLERLTRSSPITSTTFSLTLSGVCDRANVFIDSQLQGIVQRQEANGGNMTIVIHQSAGSHGRLAILVENEGRVCYTERGSKSLDLIDHKGILNGIFLNGTLLKDWTSQSVPMNMSFPDDIFKPLPSSGALTSSAMLFRGLLPAFPKGSTANDTFLLLDGWSKGVAFINGFNIGRYWPVEPPQVTLYVPSSVLRSDGTANEIVVFEQDQSPCQPPLYANCLVSFVDKPIFK